MSHFPQMKWSLLLLVSLTFSARRPALAQCLDLLCWESTGGPQSGEVTAVATGSEGTIFAGTAGKGLFYKRLNAPNWTRSSAEAFDGIRVSAIVSFGNGLIASTAGTGVWRSLDGGENWSGLSSGFSTLIVHALMVSSDGRLYAGSSSGVYRLSNDNEWIKLRGGAEGHDIRTIAETHEGVLLAGSYGRGVLRSSDHGLTWELVGNGLATTIIRTLAVNDEDEIFVGTFGGNVVQRSDDGGDTWVASGDGLEAQGIWNISIAPDGTFFAGTRSRGIFVSGDGRNWQARPSPATPVNGFAFVAGNVFAATRVGLLKLQGAAEWSLVGIPFSRVNALHLQGDRLVAGLHLGGVQYSDDNGRTWMPSTLNNKTILSFADDNSGGVLAGTLGSGVFRSMDRGESWEQIWNTIRVVSSIDVDRSDGILVATDNGVYRLAASDSAWRQLTPPGIATRSVLSTHDDVLLAGSERESIWRSSDNGETWTQVAPELRGDETWIWDLVEMPDERIAAATISEGIWLSSDAGRTWQPLPGTAEEAVADLALDGNGNLVAVGFYGQVFRLQASEIVAQAYGPPFLSAPVRSMTVLGAWTIFIGTDPLGVVQLGAIVHSEDESEHALDKGPEVYPNPARDGTTVRFATSQWSPVRWTLYDVLGRAVTVGSQVARPAGERELSIDTSRLTPGIYLVSLETDRTTWSTTLVVSR